MRWVRLVLVLLVAAGSSVVISATPASASAPSSGTVDGTTRTVAWTGGPLAFTTLGVNCAVPDPTCDRFDLTVGALPADAPDVVISAVAGNAADVLAIYVYGPDGTIVAQDDRLTSSPTVTLRRPAPGAYAVWVEAFLGSGPVTYSARATATTAGAAADAEPPCTGDDAGLGPPPQEVLDEALHDDGRVVRLDVLVLLDGVDEAYARTFFDKVALPYAELKIQVAPVFRTLPAGVITSDVTTEIIDQAKGQVPGRKVPAEFDVVELLTHRDIQALGQTAVAGQAECIGGARFKEHSFNVSEAQQGEDQGGLVVGPLRLIPEIAAKITAHEIGHLFGAQHHLANCVEAVSPGIATGFDSSPCTLMFNDAELISLHFSRVNAAIVRGYALVYAAANDAQSTAAAPGAGAASGGGAEGSGGGGGGAAAGRGGSGRSGAGRLPATGGTDAAPLALGALLLAVTVAGRRAFREFRPSR